MATISASEYEQMTRAVAIKIYAWSLTIKTKTFKQSRIPIDASPSLRQNAVTMLVDRGLLKIHRRSTEVGYSVKRMVDPRTCLNVDLGAMPLWRGVTQYKVPPAVASEMGGSKDLRKHAIGEIKEWKSTNDLAS